MRRAELEELKQSIERTVTRSREASVLRQDAYTALAHGQTQAGYERLAQAEVLDRVSLDNMHDALLTLLAQL